jgi:hypothetical protein
MSMSMSVSMSKTPSPTHLLRALLREASYLPDAVARQYFARHIVNRFRAYQPRANASTSLTQDAADRRRNGAFRRRPTAIIRTRTAPLLRKGHKALNYLRRANQGELPCLQKVLYFAYGRLGRRRYALLEDLLKPDPTATTTASSPSDPAAAPLHQLYHSNKRYLQFFDPPKPASKTHHVFAISTRYARLREVLRSQYDSGKSLSGDLKGTAFKTPILNTWKRPMPIKRARNDVRRWYAYTMSRLLPPLPDTEWDALHALSTGKKNIDYARRRTPALDRTSTPPSDEQSLHTMLHAGLALDKLSKADRSAGLNRPHTMTPKFMRRLYGRLLNLCCKLEYNPEISKWRVVWGENNKLISPRIYRSPINPILISGVDTRGAVPKEPKQPKESKDTSVPKQPSVLPRNNKGEPIRFPFFAEMLPIGHPIRDDLDKWKAERAAAAAERAAATDGPS